MYFKRITIDALMNRKLKIFLQMESTGIISMDWIQPIHTAWTYIKNTAEIHKYKHYYVHFDRQSLFIFAKLLFHFDFAFSSIRNIYKSDRNITAMFLLQLKWRDGKHCKSKNEMQIFNWASKYNLNHSSCAFVRLIVRNFCFSLKMASIERWWISLVSSLIHRPNKWATKFSL